MDHEQAVREGFAERYIHRRLTAAEMDEFEQHFFSCPECAEEVRWLAMFEDNARRAAQRSEAASAVLVDLDAATGSNAVCPPVGSQPVVLLLPPGEWTTVELFSSGGATRFQVVLDPPGRAVVVPARELTAGHYRVGIRGRDGVHREVDLHVA